jgi:hypothetical protein
MLTVEDAFAAGPISLRESVVPLTNRQDGIVHDPIRNPQRNDL